ncbi:hypothetical protein JA1_001921 [Spathaspora sp. JA1]|nr:hypothetical protein JA1_001921 [Spathaspora sp. JA1]
MVFRESGRCFEITRILYPWVETIVEEESTSYTPTCAEQNYKSTQLMLSGRNKIPCQSQESLPWVRKLTLYMNRADEDDLPAIAKLSGLTELIIHSSNKPLRRLARIGLQCLPIKSLKILLHGIFEKDPINPIHESFDLDKIITFQLHFMRLTTYSYSIKEQIRTLLSRLPNIQNLSLITPNFDFDHIMDKLKPNSLHSLHLKIIRGNSNQELQVENALQNQEMSLKRLYLSQRMHLRKELQNYGLIEFDRIVMDYETSEAELVRNISRIRNILQDGKRFRQLYQYLFGWWSNMWKMGKREELKQFNDDIQQLKSYVMDIGKSNKNNLEKINNELQQIKKDIEILGNLNENSRSTTQLELMSLPDHILADVLKNLNQIHVCRVCPINRRLYRLGKAKLYNSIYFSASLGETFHISPDLCTSFYTKFTIINDWYCFPWTQNNSNLGLVRKVVFASSGPCFDITRILYPWIDTIVENESTSYTPTCAEQNYESTQLMLSGRNKIPCQSQESMPWVRKLTLYMNRVDEDDLPAIAKLTGLTELSVRSTDDRLRILNPVGLECLPIKSLEISFSGTMEVVSIHLFQEIFDLEKIVTFQLHFLHVEKYPDDLSEQIRTLLSMLPSMQHLSLITPNIDFDHVMDRLKPNSLHELHLKIIRGNGNEELRVDHALQNQEMSLKRLYVSHRKDLHLDKQNYGLIEFDRIMGFRAGYVGGLVKDLARVRNMLRDGKRFRQLYQISLNELRLPNIQSLPWITPRIYFDHVIDRLKPNFLRVLELKIIHDRNEELQVENALPNQQMSLNRLYLSNKKDLDAEINYKLIELDRIVEDQEPLSEAKLIKNISRIRNMLRDGKRFRQLYQILLNEDSWARMSVQMTQFRSDNQQLKSDLIEIGESSKKNLEKIISEIQKIKKDNEVPRNPHENTTTTQLTLMSLSDRILGDILKNLNQIHVCQVCPTNRRLYRLGKAKLYNSIYFSISSGQKLLISPGLYTSFYTKFTIVSNWYFFPWTQDNSNLRLVRKMVFASSGPFFDMTRNLCPWIDTIVEDESTSYTPTCAEQNYKSTQLMLSGRNKIPCQSQESLPWVRKLTLYMNLVKKDYLAPIAKLTGLTELSVPSKDDRLSILNRVGLECLPIKSLEISLDGAIEVLSINLFQEIFDLEKIITFQLHLFRVEKYSDDLSEQVRELLPRLSNMQNISLITPGIDFDHVMDRLKPNSLHVLHLKFISDDGGYEKFQFDNALENQEASLQRLYLNAITNLHRGKQNHGLIEFDRIMDYPKGASDEE